MRRYRPQAFFAAAFVLAAVVFYVWFVAIFVWRIWEHVR